MSDLTKTPHNVKLVCVSAILFFISGCGTSPEDRLIGTWKGTDRFDQTMKLTFEQDDQFRIDVDGAKGGFSKFGTYKVDLSTEPGHLNITLPDRGEIQTILSLVDEQHIAFENINSGDDRPTEFGNQKIDLVRQ